MVNYQKMLEDMDCCKLLDIDENEFYILKESIGFHTSPYYGDDKEISKFNYILKNADVFSNVFSTVSGMQ